MQTKLRIALELERLRRHNLAELHPLRQLFWESTLRCNVACLHCGSDCVASVEQPDMPREDFLKVIDEEILPNVDPHTVLIIVSGGEPTVRQDLPIVGQELMKRGFPWGMVTNGVALSEEKFYTLRSAGLRSMTVSLDGLEEQHNWMRGSKHAFAGATRAIRLAAAEKNRTPGNPLAWDVVTCVNRRNISHLDEIRDYLLSLGCTNWRLFGIDPMGRAASNPELLITDDEFRYLLDYIRRQRELGIIHASYSCEGFLGDIEGQVRDHLYQCAAGLSVASILIDGSISACTSIRGKYYQGNIYRDHFWDVWENGFKPYRDRSWMRETEPCKDCKVWRYCEGNGMHLRREDGTLMICHHHRLNGEE